MLVGSMKIKDKSRKRQLDGGDTGMRYEIFKDNVKLSKLGLGAMRLPQTEPGFAGPVDELKAQEIIDCCM